MITYTQGNLLEADVEAVVNTVNTVGVMGKGIALMFKEAFPGNFKKYKGACERGEVQIGRMFITETGAITGMGARWIINFPTKAHWRAKTRIEWIVDGLEDLKRVIEENGIHSIAIPPLGCGNGGLDWKDVRPVIAEALGPLSDVEVIVYEPTSKYQNVAKRSGVKKLTPARALVAELVRRYWILGIECSLLEIQKLVWFLDRFIKALELDDQLKLRYQANKFGPYAHSLSHLLDQLDGSYLHSEKRIPDAGAFDPIWFDDAQRDKVALYLKSSDLSGYREALDKTTELIDGFESPLGMELLATIDWLLYCENVKPTIADVRKALTTWPGGEEAAARKAAIFDDRSISFALERLVQLRAA